MYYNNISLYLAYIQTNEKKIIFVVTWCRSRPWKAARQSCTHVFACARTLFPSAPLLCRSYKLRPTAADARASRRTESSRCGSLFPPLLQWSQRAVATAAAEELLRAMIGSMRPKRPESRQTGPRKENAHQPAAFPELASQRACV